MTMPRSYAVPIGGILTQSVGMPTEPSFRKVRQILLWPTEYGILTNYNGPIILAEDKETIKLLKDGHDSLSPNPIANYNPKRSTLFIHSAII